jgi:hypothetical protein
MCNAAEKPRIYVAAPQEWSDKMSHASDAITIKSFITMN